MRNAYQNEALDSKGAQNPRTWREAFAPSNWRTGLLLAGLLLSSSSLLPQSSPPDDNIFANGAANTRFPFELSKGVIIVPVSIHGSRPLRFVLDTGSTRTLIDRTVAASLGLKEGEASSLQGAGQGRIPIHALHDVDLRMPGLESKGYDCFTIDLAPVGKAVGTTEDGVLGYNFFARFVVTIDFEAKQLTVALPAAFHPPTNFEELPLEIRGKWAYVKGELVFPGRVATQDSFFIDSGSSDAVDHPIVKTLQTKKATETGVGIGTPVEGALAKAISLRIGTFTLGGPIVACCGATDATSRMIGTEVLRRFNVILDYPSSRLFLKPNRAFQDSFGSLPPASNKK
jgi:Aspartyl protease